MLPRSPEYGPIDGRKLRSVACEVQYGTQTATALLGPRPATTASPPIRQRYPMRLARPRPTRSSVSPRSWRSGRPKHSLGPRSGERWKLVTADEDVVATLISVATIIGRARVASARAGHRARHRLRHRRRPELSASSDVIPIRMTTPPNRPSRNILCAGRQLRHRSRSSAQMIGTTRRCALATQTDTSEHHDSIEPRRPPNRKSGSSMSRSNAGSDTFVRRTRTSRTLGIATGFAAQQSRLGFGPPACTSYGRACDTRRGCSTRG